MTKSAQTNSGGITSRGVGSWSHIRRGEKVKCFMGAGWATGILAEKTPDSVLIKLDKRTIRCYDPRNVKPA